MIVLDVSQRLLHLEVDDAEIRKRIDALESPAERLAIPESGYRRLYQTTVTQADIGCDFDFMVPSMTGTAPVLKGR
jgi:dihydroxy-acid dehydratase